jgi:hypothetical protein
MAARELKGMCRSFRDQSSILVGFRKMEVFIRTVFTLYNLTKACDLGESVNVTPIDPTFTRQVPRSNYEASVETHLHPPRDPPQVNDPLRNVRPSNVGQWLKHGHLSATQPHDDGSQSSAGAPLRGPAKKSSPGRRVEPPGTQDPRRHVRGRVAADAAGTHP